jgi:hypothetical protein
MKHFALFMSSHNWYWWFQVPNELTGVRGDAVGSGTALQAARSRVRFPMGFSGVDIASNKNEYHGISWRVEVVGA